MRRKDREISDINEIVRIIEKCQVCRLALNDLDGYPYIVPLNFGMDYKDGKIVLYFHSALEGHKLDLIKKDSRASFEMDCNHELQYLANQGYCTFFYESVIGKGEVKILSEEEKVYALDRLMLQHHGDILYYNKDALSRTTVYCLVVDELTGKRKERKNLEK